MALRSENVKMVGKLAVITVGMFAFGYALIPLYRAICEATGINILSITEKQVPGNGLTGAAAARSAKHALARDLTLRAAALELGLVTPEQFDAWMEPMAMAKPHQDRPTL